jgi:predicted peptidase
MKRDSMIGIDHSTKFRLSKHMRNTVLFVAIILAGTSSFADIFSKHSVTIQKVSYRYDVFVPANYIPTKKWPVILALHGSGEVGDDGRQTEAGLGEAVRSHPARFPAIVVMPQARDTWMTAESVELSLQALKYVENNYSIDLNRIYLTGLSLGGEGAWGLAAAYPHLFAALLPISSYSTLPLKSFDVLSHLPIQVFHGSNDNVVDPINVRALVNYLKAAGSTTISYIEFPGAYHNVWDRVYGDDKVLDWLFSQKRP